MFVSTLFAHWFDELRLARERARTQRIIGSLPPEIRKDIGWPDRNPRVDGPLGPARR